MKKPNVYLANYTLPNIFRIGPVRFIPGLNYLSQEDWDAIKAHPLLSHRFKEGHIVWIPGKGPDDYVAPSSGKADVESSEPDSEESDGSVVDVAENVLSSFNSKDSVKLIKETLDLALLEKWRSKEDRKGVLTALDEQIASLTADDSNQEE